ncbi:MAG TPA: protein-L-isoaspartate O-methyltransferase [Devosiaceae bacterium]|nr:protein-L-isoaspartate O-methyltransferase [Devosiaceae bacterium]
MTDFAQARRAMLDHQLRTSDVTDRRLLAAMGRVPREEFVPEARRSLAYIDRAHRLVEEPGGRALPAPTPFARLVQLAGVGAKDRVLDVGCGTGYSTAVLAELAAAVVGIEETASLADRARKTLATLGAGNAEVVEAPLVAGVPEKGPYDVIIVEGEVASVPEALQQQLADGGRLVAVIRRAGVGVAHRFVRAGDDVAAYAAFDASMPPLTVPGPSDQFVF